MPGAAISTYQPVRGATATKAPWWVLYGDLSFAKRTSRCGRKTLASPNSAPSSAHSAIIGARTHASYVARCSVKKARVFSTSRSS